MQGYAEDKGPALKLEFLSTQAMVIQSAVFGSAVLIGGKFIDYAPYIFGVIAVTTVSGQFAVHKWGQKKKNRKD